MSVEDYLRKEMLNANRLQAENNLNELIDHFALLSQYEHSNNLEMEGKDLILKTTQLPKHTKTDQSWEL